MPRSSIASAAAHQVVDRHVSSLESERHRRHNSEDALRDVQRRLIGVDAANATRQAITNIGNYTTLQYQGTLDDLAAANAPINAASMSCAAIAATAAVRGHFTGRHGQSRTDWVNQHLASWSHICRTRVLYGARRSPRRLAPAPV